MSTNLLGVPLRGIDNTGSRWTLPREAVETYDTDSSEFQISRPRISDISPQTSYYSNPYEIERSVIPRDARSVFYSFFSAQNVQYISREITRRLAGVHPEGKNIIVADKQIVSVMDSIYKNTYRDIDKMTVMVVGYLVDYVTADIQTEVQNKKLSIWTTNFGPETGLRQFSKIKVRERRATPMIFQTNY